MFFVEWFIDLCFFHPDKFIITIESRAVNVAAREQMLNVHHNYKIPFFTRFNEVQEKLSLLHSVRCVSHFQIGQCLP